MLFWALMQNKPKVLVGISGGVDSSVAAALLVEQGYEVIGGFMKNWSSEKDAYGVCEWEKEYRDAQRVAAHLNIPLHFFDFEAEYRAEVYDTMVAEYRAGRTPNPDVLCNQFIKFGYFLRAADELACEFVATGHYAGAKDGHLLRAKDEGKDQTYFLHRLTADQVRRSMFPLQVLTKDEVKAKAEAMGLFTATKEESMGICFVGELSIKEFLAHEVPQKPGDVVTEKGEVIGQHDGLAFYTIGQRHGFTQPGGGEPLYVAQKNFETGQLVVAPKESGLLLSKEIELTDVHWISEPVTDCFVRLRHRAELIPATIEGQKVRLEKAQWGVTPGQYCVFYSETECLGGGVIA